MEMKNGAYIKHEEYGLYALVVKQYDAYSMNVRIIDDSQKLWSKDFLKDVKTEGWSTIAYEDLPKTAQDHIEKYNQFIKEFLTFLGRYDGI